MVPGSKAALGLGIFWNSSVIHYEYYAEALCWVSEAVCVDMIGTIRGCGLLLEAPGAV